MENILLAGKDADYSTLEKYGCKVHTHWRKPTDQTSLPFSIDRIVLLSDAIDLNLAQCVRALSEREEIPLTYTKSCLTSLEEDLKKTSEPMYSNVVYLPYQPTRSKKMPTENKTNKSSQRAALKEDHLRELLKKDAQSPTHDLHNEIVKKFGSGLTPQRISEIRWEEFGVKFGPRGKVIFNPAKAPHANAQTPAAPKVENVATQPTVAPAPITARPMTSDAVQNEKLVGLLSQLRHTMADSKVLSVTIPSNGPAEIVYEVTRQLALN